MVCFGEVAAAGRPGRRSARGVATLAVGVSLLATIGLPASASAATTRASDAHRVHAASSSTFVVADTSSVQKLDPDVVTNFLDFQALGLIYDQLVQ